MLEKTPVKFVGRSQILPQKPFSIARHIVHRVELIAQKTRTHQTDAFLGQFRTDRMEFPKIRRHPFETSTPPPTPPHPPSPPRPPPRTPLHHPPTHRPALPRLPPH